MGARQSKRSVDISGTPKKGEVENGAVAVPEGKLEKIEEGETVAAKVNANGSTTTTSTVTAEQQEAAVATTEASPEPDVVADADAVAEKSAIEEVASPAPTEHSQEEVSSPASPAETSTTEEEGSEKKKPKKKRGWSFRSFSFSKKDKQKPSSKDEPKTQATVPEANENAAQAEQSDDKEQKQEVTTVSNGTPEEPPPLPTSPPPTPAEEVPAVVAPVASVAAAPEKEDIPIVSENDVDMSGGGEGLAEPIEEGELEESTATSAVAAAPNNINGTSLTNGTNGTGELNGQLNGDEESSPVCERKASVDSVTAKIDALKLQITTDSTESPGQNGVADVTSEDLHGTKENGASSNEIAVGDN